MIEIDKMILSAMKEKNELKLKVYRAIKTEFINYKTAKNAKPLDDTAEINIINKMIKQRVQSSQQYIYGNRIDLSNAELNEVIVLETLIPKQATEKDINEAIYSMCLDKGWYYSQTMIPYIPKKFMGESIKIIKSKLNNVDGKQLADIIKTYLN